MSSLGGFGLQNLGVPVFPLLAPAGSSTAPSYSFSAQPTLGLYSPSTGVLAATGSGFLAGRVVTAKTAGYQVTELEKRTLYTNTGAGGSVPFALPVSPTVGDEYTFYVDAAFALQVTVNSPDTIRLASAVSIAGGNIASSTVGSSVTLVCIKANVWIATSIVGSWTVT